MAEGVRRPTRIVLVGAGERARATLIPAIHASASRVELAAVCARSERTIELLGGRFRTPTSLLADVDLSGVDAVVVSVGTKSVPGLLAELADRGGSGTTLMLDTPVLDPSNLRAARLFERFRAVLASEDNYCLPLYVLARRLLDEGRVGRLQRAYLFHSGYRHHALAALGRLTGTRARRVSVDRSNRWCAEVHVAFPGGVRALVVEPRRYDIGRTHDRGRERVPRRLPDRPPQAGSASGIEPAATASAASRSTTSPSRRPSSTTHSRRRSTARRSRTRPS